MSFSWTAPTSGKGPRPASVGWEAGRIIAPVAMTTVGSFFGRIRRSPDGRSPGGGLPWRASGGMRHRMGLGEVARRDRRWRARGGPAPPCRGAVGRGWRADGRGGVDADPIHGALAAAKASLRTTATLLDGVQILVEPAGKSEGRLSYDPPARLVLTLNLKVGHASTNRTWLRRGRAFRRARLPQVPQRVTGGREARGTAGAETAYLPVPAREGVMSETMRRALGGARPRPAVAGRGGLSQPEMWKTQGGDGSPSLAPGAGGKVPTTSVPRRASRCSA